MSTLAATSPTLADLAARMEDKKIAKVVEILNMTNEILDDMAWIECNDGTNHRTTIRSGLPSGTWRLLNYGVQPEKSRSVQISDSTGMLESYAVIDKALADLNGNSAAFRLSEDMAFIEGMSQTMASTIVYGNISSDPEKFTGLAPRYNSLSAENGENIIDGGGTGSDNTSIWFVTWGNSICHGLYPKGSVAGLKHRDLGEDTETDAAGGKYQIYRSHYKWDAGLTLRDWRGLARIANVDVNELADAGESGFDGADIPNLMIRAYHKIRRVMKRGRTVIYVNETVYTALDLVASNRTNTWFTKEHGVDGMPIVKFRGIPIKQVDAILDTEEAVS